MTVHAGALSDLAALARGCTRCPLFESATQTVFGEGRPDAAVVFVGEEPGDQEDLAGHPFVGPAGRLFDRALREAGIDRSSLYVTNAVKHFKFIQRGKRRMHRRPNAGEIEQCHWWLERELSIIKPRLTVALGATAARSLLGHPIVISRVRRETLALPSGGPVRITVHPSSLLRQREAARRDLEFSGFVEDLRQVADFAPAIRTAAR